MALDLYDGDFSTSSLQTSSSTINLIARNNYNLKNGDFYLLFFAFPLRKNGRQADGCGHPNGTIYGDAYYHENIWAIVC